MRSVARAAALGACAAACGACDSVAVLPSATAEGLGGMYGKNADRSHTEAQPVAIYPRQSHPKGSTITFNSGLTIPQVALTYAHAGARPYWATSYGGYSEGVNEWGVGIGNEHFPSHALPTDKGAAPATEFTDLDRLVLERAKTAAEAVQVFTDLVEKYGQTCQTCPSAANYNSLFMIADTADVYSVMAVGHEWGWKKVENDDPVVGGTGVWTISNGYFTGATNVSATAQATAEKNGWYKKSDGPFDFGKVYGTTGPNSRQKKTEAYLKAAAKDHPLTKADLMATLRLSGIDEMSSRGGVSASSMVSDFTTDGRRRIAWHALVNPSMGAYYPVFFHHDGLASQYDDWMTSTKPWFDQEYVTYHLCGSSTKKKQYVQDTWAPIQERFFKDAEDAADRAAGMSSDDATKLLAGVTQNVSATIRATLEHFNATLPNM